jgi:23S rRNA (guanosine2251-2'-O)-methyltransferase
MKRYTCGRHSVEVLLNNRPEKVVELYIDKKRQEIGIDRVSKIASGYGIAVYKKSKALLDNLVNGANHQGIAALVHDATNNQSLCQLLEYLDHQPLLLILDQVQDPHNLGACLRSAEVTGVDAVIVPQNQSVGLTPSVSKVASGAAELVPFYQVTNLARTIKKIKQYGLWVIGADERGEKPIYEWQFYEPTALVMGGENRGLRRLTRDNCDSVVTIPARGMLASMNVSVATGIGLYEALRQRLEKSALSINP